MKYFILNCVLTYWLPFQSHNADSILEEDETGSEVQDSLLLVDSSGRPKVVLARKRPWTRIARRLFTPHRFKNLQVGHGKQYQCTCWPDLAALS